MARRRSDGRPERSCVQCGAKDAKERLIRVAGRAGSGYEPDPAGRRPGRGLYLCRAPRCVDGFLKRVASPKGRARWGMGAPDAGFAGRLRAMIGEDEIS